MKLFGFSFFLNKKNHKKSKSNHFDIKEKIGNTLQENISKQELTSLLKYAKENKSTNIFFMFSVNYLLCNPSKIDKKMLVVLQDVFLSYSQEEKNKRYSGANKFPVNFDNESVDTINKLINKFLENEDQNKLELMQNKVELMECLHNICRPLVGEALVDLDDYMKQKETKKNDLKELRKSFCLDSNGLIKTLHQAGFILLQTSSEAEIPKNTLFKKGSIYKSLKSKENEKISII